LHSADLDCDGDSDKGDDGDSDDGVNDVNGDDGDDGDDWLAPILILSLYL
jgi:hypothetical protein